MTFGVEKHSEENVANQDTVGYGECEEDVCADFQKSWQELKDFNSTEIKKMEEIQRYGTAVVNNVKRDIHSLYFLYKYTQQAVGHVCGIQGHKKIANLLALKERIEATREEYIVKVCASLFQLAVNDTNSHLASVNSALDQTHLQKADRLGSEASRIPGHLCVTHCDKFCCEDLSSHKRFTNDHLDKNQFNIRKRKEQRMEYEINKEAKQATPETKCVPFRHHLPFLKKAKKETKIEAEESHHAVHATEAKAEAEAEVVSEVVSEGFTKMNPTQFDRASPIMSLPLMLAPLSPLLPFTPVSDMTLPRSASRPIENTALSALSMQGFASASSERKKQSLFFTNPGFSSDSDSDSDSNSEAESIFDSDFGFDSVSSGESEANSPIFSYGSSKNIKCEIEGKTLKQPETLENMHKVGKFWAKIEAMKCGKLSNMPSKSFLTPLDLSKDFSKDLSKDLCIEKDNAASSLPFSVASDYNIGLSAHKRNKKISTRFTEEQTTVLGNWLCKNWEHPFPSLAKKAELALEAKMTVEQVTNWYTNARGRYIHKIKLLSPLQLRHLFVAACNFSNPQDITLLQRNTGIKNTVLLWFVKIWQTFFKYNMGGLDSETMVTLFNNLDHHLSKTSLLTTNRVQIDLMSPTTSPHNEATHLKTNVISSTTMAAITATVLTAPKTTKIHYQEYSTIYNLFCVVAHQFIK